MFSMQTMTAYLRENLGVAAVWFGLTVPMVVSAVGMSVDLGQSYLVRERLSRALDAAALAAAASGSEDSHEVEKKVNDFIKANYPPDKVGFTTEIEVNNTAEVLYVTAHAQLKPTFLKVFGKEYIDVSVHSEVTKEVKAIEVVLVMDVTGSMSTNNNIKALRDSAKEFVKTMFERVRDKKYIKIGLVPFSSSVNVGPYGLGKTLANLPYDDPFVNNPSKLKYNPNNSSEWSGCVVEGPYPDDIEDHDGPWDMYRYCRTAQGAVIPGCDTTRSGKSPNYTYTANRNQNYLCPKTPVTPLTNNRTDLDASIDLLKAEGNTYINSGLAWGLRLISPEFPFREAVSWKDPDWKKAIVLMTDGESMMHTYYSIYGPTADHNINSAGLDERIKDVCEILREKKVLVYTITFDKGVSSTTKKIFEKCATEPNMWYDAPTQAKLKEVYLTIAKELANIHLSK